MTGVTEKLFMCQMFMCLFRPLVKILADVSDIFYFFLLFRGRGKGGRVRGEKGGVLLVGNREGGHSEEGRRG